MRRTARIFTLNPERVPLAFQAGHAGSIPVTRSASPRRAELLRVTVPVTVLSTSHPGRTRGAPAASPGRNDRPAYDVAYAHRPNVRPPSRRALANPARPSASDRF